MKKRVTLILYLILFFTNNTIVSQENKNLSEKDNYTLFLSERNLEKKSQYFYKINDFTKYKSIEEWITYFDTEKEEYSNFPNYVFLLDFYKILIYSKEKNFEVANNLAYDLYFESKFKIDKVYLCSLLRKMNANFLREKKIFEMFYVNNEMLEICPENANLSNIYSFLSQPKLAIKLLKQHRGFKKDSISYQNAQSLNDFGVFYKRNNEYDSAYYYFQKSLSYLNTIKKREPDNNEYDLDILIGVVKGNIGECFLNNNKYEDAKMYLFEEAASAKELIKQNKWGFQNDFYRDIAYCYINTGNVNLGKKYIDSLDQCTYVADYYKLQATYYTKKKNIDSATYFNDKYTRLSDSINRKLTLEKNNSLLKLLEYPIKLAEKEEENYNIQRLNDSKQRRYEVIGLFLVIAILIILLLYYFFVKEKNQNKLIAVKNEEIEKSLAEKGVLYSELNHRVKNNLQLIISILKMQMNKLSEEDFKNTFQYSINRISTIANLHQDLLKSKTIAKISLNDFVHTIVNDLKQIYGYNQQIEFELNINKDLYIDIEQNQALGLIVNELVTNSYKHAFKNQDNNRISIIISNKLNQVYFNYKDNGKGFKLEQVDKKKSIGLTLIQRLANQLGATASIITEAGVLVKFKFTNKLKV